LTGGQKLGKGSIMTIEKIASEEDEVFRGRDNTHIILWGKKRERKRSSCRTPAWLGRQFVWEGP